MLRKLIRVKAVKKSLINQNIASRQEAWKFLHSDEVIGNFSESKIREKQKLKIYNP